MCPGRKATVRDLHLKTSAILDQVTSGHSFVIERRGMPVAELKPISIQPSSRRLPDRERRLAKMRPALDSGRILEQDRT